VREALPLTEYKLNLARGKHDLATTEGNLAFLKAAAGILRALGPVEADVYIKKLAEESHISEGAIRSEMQGGAKTGAAAPPGHMQAGEKRSRAADAPSGGSFLERNFIRLLLLDGQYLPRIEAYAHVFKTPPIYRIYAEIASVYGAGRELDLQKLADTLDGQERELLRDIRENIHLADKAEEVFAECVKSIRVAGMSAREAEIIRMLTVANESENQEKIRELTQELLDIQKEMKGVKSR
ncbi:MAG: hypothetical protein LBT26_06970, partial [Clostridiales Family XIII bacterium]|nr:hypothetical protein [Clostridiales Family XIII bacterium]